MDKKQSIFLVLFIISACPVFSQDMFFFKARAFEERNMPDSAFFYYNSFLEKKQQDWNALLYRGNLYFKQGKYQEAIEDFNKAEKIKKDVASFSLSKTYARLKDTAKAISYLERHLSSSYKLQASQLRMEPCFTFMENTEAWKKLWQKNWYNKLDEQLGEADYYAKSGDWLGLINYVNELSKDGDLRPDLLYLRAKAYFMMDNADMALTDLNKLIDRVKRNRFYFELRADVNMSGKNFKAAEADLTNAIGLENDAFVLYKKRAYCRYELGLIELGMQDIIFLTNLFPDNKDIILLSVQLSSKAKLHLKALTGINKLISQDSLNARYYMIRGEIYENAGMGLQAGKDYNFSTKLAPNYTEAYLARGKFLLKINNVKDACADLKKAEKMGNTEAGRLVFENCNQR